MPPISVMIKPSSGMCNMSCEYCFYCDEAQKRKKQFYGLMSESTLQNVVKKTMHEAEGVVNFIFQGGEPTLRGIDFFEKVVAYQKQFNEKGLRVYNFLQTNGFLLDADWCRFLKENGFLVGVSVDGIKETHDLYRLDKAGYPTYERILNNIKLLDLWQVDYNILTVVNQSVAKNVREIYESYQKNGWLFQQYIPCIDPLEAQRGKKAYALQPEQYGEFMIQLFHLWYADWNLGKEPYIRQFDNYIAILVGLQPEACEHRGKCGIQNVVEADGSVYPCDFYMTDEYKIGNYNEDQLSEINQRRIDIGFIESSEMLSKQCQSCRYYCLCRGGCKRYRDENKFDHTYQNYFCKSYQMFFETCMEKLQIIANTIVGRY